MEFPMEIRRSRRRSIAMYVRKDLSILVKAPLFMTDEQIGAFVEKHRLWAERHRELQAEANAKVRALTREEIAELYGRAAEFVRRRVPYYAARMDVAPAGLKITRAVTRWGSCSAKNSLCFSYRIALLPEKAADYVVVHELAHIRVKNHGPRFYAEVEKILPDYRERTALIRETQRELGL